MGVESIIFREHRWYKKRVSNSRNRNIKYVDKKLNENIFYNL
jgi:hypothetical protein